jgi:hypothetical protein
LDHLTGKRLSDFGAEKWDKHHDLLRGRSIGLYGGLFNASFDNYGDANLEDLVRYTPVTVIERSCRPVVDASERCRSGVHSAGYGIRFVDLQYGRTGSVFGYVHNFARE